MAVVAVESKQEIFQAPSLASAALNGMGVDPEILQQVNTGFTSQDYGVADRGDYRRLSEKVEDAAKNLAVDQLPKEEREFVKDFSTRQKLVEWMLSVDEPGVSEEIRALSKMYDRMGELEKRIEAFAQGIIEQAGERVLTTMAEEERRSLESDRSRHQSAILDSKASATYPTPTAAMFGYQRLVLKELESSNNRAEQLTNK